MKIYCTTVARTNHAFSNQKVHDFCSGQKSATTKRPAFRPFYVKLAELRSLAGPDTPVIALTATASVETDRPL